MQFRSRRSPAIACVFAFLLLVVSGCSSTRGTDSTGMTPEEREMGNLREAIDVLKQALTNMSAERNQFQQQYLSAADELRTRATSTAWFEARHRVHMQELQRAEEKMRIALNAQTNLQQINAQQLDKRRELEGTLKKLQSQLTDNTDQHGQLTVQVRELQLSLEQAQAENNRMQQQLAGSTQSNQNTSQALQARAKEIEQLRAQLNSAQGKLSEAEKGRQVAINQLAKAKEVWQQGGSDTAATDKASAFAFLTRWGKTSVQGIQKGNWTNDNKLFAGVAGGVLILLLMLLVSTWRSRRARSKLSALKEEMASLRTGSSPTPLRMDEVSPAVAQVHQAAEDLAKTMHLSPLNSSSSLNQPSPPMATQVISHAQQPAPQYGNTQRRPGLTNSVISRHLDGVFGGDDDDAATIMIPSPRGKEAGVSTPQKPRGNGPKVNDADLLNDLQQAIQDKFKELKD